MEAKEILNRINEMTSNELVELNNLYCESANYSDDYIYSNDEEFFDMFYSNRGDGLKVAQAVCYGDYNYTHDWVKFDGHGNLQSFNYFEPNDLCELPYTMAEYISENFSDFEELFK